MKKLSILVFFLFTLSGLSVGQFPSSSHRCDDQIRRIEPCAGEISALIRQKQPISSSCCATILNATGECSHHLPPLFYKIEKYCHVVKFLATTPPKPSSPPLPPPQACPDLKRIVPCIKEIIGHRRFNRTIGSTCCATITDIGEKCPQIKWPWFTQSRDHCPHQSNNVGAAAKPPARKLLLYNLDFPVFPWLTSRPPQQRPVPQAPRNFFDCEAGRKTYDCMPQYWRNANMHLPINSTCCGLLLNATKQCVGAQVPTGYYSQALAYCQHPEKESSPVPPPPPPPPPSPEEGVQKCWSFLDTLPSCINEILSGFLNNRWGVGPACCNAISSWREDCFGQLYRQFPDRVYPQFLRQQCYRP